MTLTFCNTIESVWVTFLRTSHFHIITRNTMFVITIMIFTCAFFLCEKYKFNFNTQIDIL